MRPSPSRPLLLIPIVVTACALAPRASFACAACGGDPSITAMGGDRPFRNRVRLSLEEAFASRTVGDGADVERTLVLRSTLSASWSPTSWLTVAALLPVVSVWSQPDGAAWRNATGLGDAEVLARVVLYRERPFAPRHLLQVLGGLKLPTGPRAIDSTGYPAPDDDQPGSGSWDAIAGASYAFAAARTALYATAYAQLTTPGRHGYQRGHMVLASVGAQESWQRVAVALSIDLHWSAPDTLGGGAAAPNTGGAMLSLVPALLVRPTASWVLKLAVQVHVAEWLNGAQQEGYGAVLSTVVDL